MWFKWERSRAKVKFKCFACSHKDLQKVWVTPCEAFKKISRVRRDKWEIRFQVLRPKCEHRLQKSTQLKCFQVSHVTVKHKNVTHSSRSTKVNGLYFYNVCISRSHTDGSAFRILLKDSSTCRLHRSSDQWTTKVQKDEQEIKLQENKWAETPSSRVFYLFGAWKKSTKLDI